MSTDQLASDSRSISEVYGTVLIIAISFLTAMLLFGFGTFILGSIGGDTEDRITQDSMFEMEDRLAEISGSQVDANTQFSFPDTDGDDLETMPDHGTVNVTVEATEELDYLRASSETNSTEFDVGTVKHETGDGIVTAYQGGAMIRQQGDFSTMLTDPPFDYDGTMVAFDFVDTTSMPAAHPGQEITARTNVEGAQAFSEEIEDLLSPKWSYIGEGDFIAPINVTVTIETEYYEAWEEYAEEGMTESPDSVETDGSAVEMTFYGVGTERQPPRYEANEILYAGIAGNVFEGWNRFNQNSTVTESDEGFKIERVTGGSDAVQKQQLAFYDEKVESWVILGDSNDDGYKNVPPNLNRYAWFDILNHKEYPDVEQPKPIESVYRQGSQYQEYEFNSSHEDTPICVVAYGEQVDEDNNMVEHLETCAANLDVPNPVEYMPTELNISFQGDDYDFVVGNSDDVKLTIENVGLVDSTTQHDVGLYYEDGGRQILANYTRSENISDKTSGEHFEVGDSHDFAMEWEPFNESIDTLYAVVGQQDTDSVSVNVTDTGPHLDITVEEDTPDVVTPGDSLTVNTTIENSASAGAENAEVVMEDESGDIVDLTRVDVGAGEKKTVELNWLAPLEGFEGEELTVEVQDSSETHEVSPDDVANFVVNDVNPGVATSDDGLDVTVEVGNDGAVPGDEDVILIVDGETLDGTQAADVTNTTLNSGETTELTLSWDGAPELASGDANQVTVEVGDDSKTAGYDVEGQLDIAIDDIDPSPELHERAGDTDITAPTIEQGDSVTVDATVRNIGDKEETQDVRFKDADGSLVEHKEITLSGEDEEEPSFTLSDTNESVTGNVSVHTDDASDEERILVDRHTPICDDVNYDTEDGYRLVETVDQLQCIDEDLTEDYRLANDIDAYGTMFWNDGEGFDPIGEMDGGQGGDAFEGDFDGQGNTIEGLTIDRFENGFVGLFGITAEFDGGSDVGEGVTIEDIVMDDISVRGKSVVGGVAGGAGGELGQISVDGYVESQYQQVGGIVGHGHDADLSNQLVSTATVEGTYPSEVDGEHPWGADNLGIGGIVGGTGFNTDVSTAYSRATVRGNSAVGGITGWTSDFDSTNEQMYWVEGHVELTGDRKLDEIGRSDLDDNPKAGAIAGRMELDSDNFEDSVYSDENYRSIGEQEADADDIPLSPADMKGPQVLPDDRPDSFYENYPGVTRDDAEGTMANLDWDIWEPVYDFNATTGEIENEDYPRFQWQAEAEGAFQVDDVDSAEKVKEGEELDLTVTIKSTYTDNETQNVLLRDGDGTPLDAHSTSIEGSAFGESETKIIDLTWDVGFDVEGAQELIIETDDQQVLHEVEVEPIEDPEFEIAGVSTEDNDSESGDEIEVEVDLENTGGDGTQVVILEREDENGEYRYLTHDDVSIEGGESESVTLDWQTRAQDGGNNSLQVRTLGDTERLDLYLVPQAPAEFTIDSVSTNDPVLAGQTLTVEATITNEGNLEGEPLVSLSPIGEDNALDVTRVKLDGGESDSVELVWNTPIPSVAAVEVDTGDDMMTKEVEILSPTADDIGFGNPLDIDVDLIEFDDS